MVKPNPGERMCVDCASHHEVYLIQLATRFIRRLRRYGWKRTWRKMRVYFAQRLDFATTDTHWDETILGDFDTFAKHWYDSALVRETVRRRICPPAMGKAHEGLATWLDRVHPGRRFARGLSIGCGSASRELELIASGRVTSFVCYELGGRLIETARAEARRRGIETQIEFRQMDAFARPECSAFDLVFWHHSLHHMFDVAAAVRFSHDALADDGVFLAEEFVGPSRFQWTDANVELMNTLRAQLPERFFRRLDFPQEKFPRRIERPSPEQVIRTDPSEAVQSGEILRAVVRYFRGAEIRLLGGAAFHIGLEGIIGNFNESDESDLAILREFLEADRAAIANPAIGSHFAAIMATKD